MATDTIPADGHVCKAAASAYWDGATVAEDLALDAERVSETAWALACSQSFCENSQHAFASLAQLAERMQKKAKANEDRLTALSGKGRGA